MSQTTPSPEKSYIVTKIPLKSGTTKKQKHTRRIKITLFSTILTIVVVLFASFVGHAVTQNNANDITNNKIATTNTDPVVPDNTQTQTLSDNKTQTEPVAESVQTEPAETKPATEPATESITELSVVETNIAWPNFFDEEITFKMNYIYSPDSMPYTLISPTKNGKVITDEPLPLIVWLHGSGEKNVDPFVFLNRGLPDVFQDRSSEGFRAYIICPQLDGNYNPGAWYLEESATNLNNLLTQFISEHNIDTNNIVIMGHSLGGQGALYMAHHFNGELYPDLFKKCVVLSGYNPQRSNTDPVDMHEIDMPILAYVGTKDAGEDTSSINFSLGQLAPIIGESSVISLDSDHGSLPRVALTLDENNNNRSDVIEWLFDTNGDNKIDDFVTTADYSENIADTSSTYGVYDSIPLYFQTDYPDVPYSQGSLATSGCGISCFSMVATYLLDEEYTPDELARFTGSSGDNASRFEKAAESLGITWEKTWSWNKTVEALQNGYVAIALVNENTPFTEGGHFIVLTGITSDGKILVNDPNEANYRRMKTQYENGFDQSDITCGFSGAWLFKKN